MELRPGLALDSAVDQVSVIVTRAPGGDVDLRCGGHPLVAKGAGGTATEGDPSHAQGTLLGKRYVDAAGTLEVLCTKPGPSSLSLGDEPLTVASAKALPSSD